MQYEVEAKRCIKKGERVYFFKHNSGGRLGPCVVPSEPCPSSCRAFAKQDLSPGDIVEIVGDYAVKVGVSMGLPTATKGNGLNNKVIVNIGPQTIELPDAVNFPNGTQIWFQEASAAPSPNRKQECKCPFVNLLLVHTANCSHYRETKF